MPLRPKSALESHPQPTDLPCNSAGQLVSDNGFGTVHEVHSPCALKSDMKLVFSVSLVWPAQPL